MKYEKRARSLDGCLTVRCASRRVLSVLRAAATLRHPGTQPRTSHTECGDGGGGPPGLVVVVVVLLLLLAEALVLYLRGLCPLSRRVVAPMPLCDGGQLRCVPTAVARPALRGRVERAPPRRRQRHGGLLVRQPPAASTRIEVASVLLAHLVRVKVKAKMSVRGRRDGVPRARVEASVKTRAHLPTRAAPPVLPPFDKPAVPVCARGRRA